jgi:presqualene diphosphate synthase
MAQQPDFCDVSEMDPQRHVQAVVAASGSSFAWAMRFLPRERRQAIFTVYAFCREVDDIADGEDSAEEKRSALAQWRREIDLLYTGRPTKPTALALHEPVKTFNLERDAFLAVIDGMEMDIDNPICAPTMADLVLYCSRVAGAVGRLCVRIFGEPGPAGQRTAESLGLALQLTNILRDLEEDAEIGRLYLPVELLAAQGIEAADPKAVLRNPKIPAVCRALATRAEAAFAEAETAIAQCSDKAHMRPAIIMMMVYKKSLERLLAADWRYLAGPGHGGGNGRISKAEKLLIALRYGLF